MNSSKGSFLYKRSITIGVLLLVAFGSLMIASAEMGNSVGESGYLSSVLIKQLIYAVVALFGYFIILGLGNKLNFLKINLRFYWVGYAILLVMLLACRLFGATNGAYAWIPLGSVGSIQPSEFCKTFMILFAARLLGKDRGDKNIDNIKRYGVAAALYVVVILAWQHDTGSAIVLAIMCYCMALIPGYKEYKKIHSIMIIIIIVVVALFALMMTPAFTNFLKNYSDDYRIARFLAAADPFLYRYDSGYHLVMALVSFANGGIFGLGYGNSTHKYMNFPNPSNDFILPIIVEELGVFGFLFIVIGYGMILLPVIKYSMKTSNLTSKIIMIGVFLYFICHFILNVGGVSGFIPLTGVPLLIISSGGSSLVSCLLALSFAQVEIDKKEMQEEA